jgi:hypothetical protein
MPDRNDQDSRCDQLLWSRLRREQSRRLPRGLSVRDSLTMMRETGIRREDEAARKAAGASLRSAVKTATRIIRKEERAGAATIVGCGAAFAQAGV